MWEFDDGTKKLLNICLGVQKCMQYYFSERIRNPTLILFPFLLPYCFTPSDMRYERNNNSVNSGIMDLVKERKK